LAFERDFSSLKSSLWSWLRLRVEFKDDLDRSGAASSSRKTSTSILSSSIVGEIPCREPESSPHWISLFGAKRRINGKRAKINFTLWISVLRLDFIAFSFNRSELIRAKAVPQIRATRIFENQWRLLQF
jgi:hypothetical protein